MLVVEELTLCSILEFCFVLFLLSTKIQNITSIFQ